MNHQSKTQLEFWEMERQSFVLPDLLTVIAHAFALIAYSLMGGGEKRGKECNIS